MFRHLFYLLISISIISCTADEGDNSLLTQSPYNFLTDSIKSVPNNADLYYRRGILLYQNGEKALAETDIRTAWSKQPSEPYALSFATLLREKSPDSAVLFLEKAKTILPQSVAIQVSLARGHQQKGDLSKALSVSNDILALYPNQLDALTLKAEILQEQGKEPEALNTLEQAYRYAPFDIELVHNLAFSYAEARNSKALLLSDSLIQNDTSGRRPEPYYFKGLYYEYAGSPTEAIRFFDEAIKRDYYFLDAYMEKGQVLYDLKKYNEALRTFQLAATITPTFAPAYFWLAKTLQATGNKADAKLNYQRAYQLDKTMKEAKDAADKL